MGAEVRGDSTGFWHPASTFKYVEVAGTITGCGLAQLSGVATLTEEVLDEIKEQYQADGVGAIICTLGQAYYDEEPKLLKLGFELLKEYHNYRHEDMDGETYLQRLYILTL